VEFKIVRDFRNVFFVLFVHLLLSETNTMGLTGKL